MWAVESGNISPEVSADVTYYIMAKEFGFTDEEVDSTDSERVKSYMFLDTKTKEKEKKELERSSQRRY